MLKTNICQYTVMHTVASLKTFSSMYVATADTSHNILNTWECVPLNTYHISDLLQSQYIQ